MITPTEIRKAYSNLKDVVVQTPLQFSDRLSKKYKAKIYLKREDLQVVRSYKIRGAYNLMSQLTPKQRRKGVVCASAGNHAQGVALSCRLLRTKGKIFMPRPTPKQKIDRVQALGDGWVDLTLTGDTFDETYETAKKYCTTNQMTFVHPFDDPKVIAGQATVGVEIFRQLKDRIDFIVAPIGGGGLMSGLGTYAKSENPKVKLIGVEPAGAPAMEQSLKKRKVITLPQIDKFVDGAAVQQVGQLTFEICSKIVDKMILVPEGKLCQDMITMYQSDGIIAEPAGALAVSALDAIANQIKKKTVVVVVSGGNNDITRYSEIMERSLMYQGLRHYFIIEFSQRPGALRRYLDEALGPGNDIILFEYVKKNNRESGPALVGLEIAKKEDLKPLLTRMDKIGLKYELIKHDSELFKFII